MKFVYPITLTLMYPFIKKLLLGFILSLCLFSAPLFAYDDVPSDSPYFYSIEYLRRNDVFPDKKLFRPDTLISRAEFIKYLVLLNNPKTDTEKKVKLPFEDTQDSAWYAPYFKEALSLGILSDRGKTVQPYKKISKLEALELLFHSRSIPIPRQYVGPIPYKDLEKNKNAQALVMRALELGVTVPESADNVGLYKRLTKKEVAWMIYKMDLVDLRDPQFFSTAVSSGPSDPGLKKINDVWSLINSNYYKKDEVESGKLSDTAIQSMLKLLNDPYSTYMSPEENQNFSDEIEGEFEGIGAYIAIDENKRIVIVAPIKDTPAYRAGVKSGDIVLKVDDFSALDASLQEVVTRIKGPKGTTVKLTLERAGATVVLDVVRDTILVKSLEYETVGSADQFMHIKLINFSETAVQDFEEVVQIITQNKNIKGVILDLRDNPGGLLDTAIGILNYLLPKDSTAVQIKYSYFSLNQTTTKEGELKNYPMTVLINKGSASASEIVAGALKEYKIAKLIGETTFGKGTVQELNYFADNSSLKLTIAEWLTPNGTSINEKGIAPDIEVIQGTGQTQDVQLERAIQEVERQLR